MKWWTARQRDADLRRELQSDLDLEEEEQRERGLSPEDAHYAALRAFGNPRRSASKPVPSGPLSGSNPSRATCVTASAPCARRRDSPPSPFS